jgi:hypothetical protein
VSKADESSSKDNLTGCCQRWRWIRVAYGDSFFPKNIDVSGFCDGSNSKRGDVPKAIFE